MTTATPEAPPVADAHLENAWLVARTADDFRGKNIVVLDMQPITPLVDYFVLATANSIRQMRAMGNEANRVMKSRGRTKAICEGDNVGSMWVLYDFGDVVLHVFTPEGRDFYRLEELWADASKVEWREPGREVREEDEYENYFAQHYQPSDDDEDETYDESDPEIEAIVKMLPPDELDESCTENGEDAELIDDQKLDDE